MSKVYAVNFMYDNGASIDHVKAAVKAEDKEDAKKVIFKTFLQDTDCSVDKIEIREMAEHEVISNARMLVVNRR